jgi:hypothetical protein
MQEYDRILGKERSAQSGRILPLNAATNLGSPQ